MSREPSATNGRAPEIIEWLASDECHELDAAGLIDSLGTRLRATGLPLDRVAVHLRTLHPKLFGSTAEWAPGEPVVFREFEYGAEVLRHAEKNPVLHVMSTRAWLVLRTTDPRWLLNELFLGRDLAELIIAPIIHGPAGQPVSAVTFATQRPSGFSPIDQALLRRIVPALRGAVELRMWRRTATTLLDTYVGTETGRRILSGHIRRGDIETLEAALMFCDLHAFTALSNRLPSERVLELLNIYFDQVVPAISDRSGEVLKFLGDGVLAFFHNDGGPSRSCAAAFEAAHLVHQRLATVSVTDAELRAGIALHFGEVSYGNIGAGDRLDFTVIGRDVNLTSRIQALCGSTNQSLLMSERFAALLARRGTVPIGRYELKGFVEPVALFAWTGSSN